MLLWCPFDSVVSSMSSFTAWTEKSFDPVGRTDEVWHSGLYHPPQPLLYGEHVHIWTVRGELETSACRRQVDHLFVFLSVCQYKIQAYPTTVIFNGSSVHEYEGQHSADGILEFIQVTMSKNDMLVWHNTRSSLLLFLARIHSYCWENRF